MARRPSRHHSAPRRPGRRPQAGAPAAQKVPALRGIVAQRPLDGAAIPPDVTVRVSRWQPFLFRKMLGPGGGGAERNGAEPGDMVRAVDGEGRVLGYGLYNPRSKIPIRLLTRGEVFPDDAWWRARLLDAVRLRRHVLRLDEDTDAYRVVHAEADGLSGLVIDRFGDVLSAEIFSLGMLQRIEALMAELVPMLGTRHSLVQADAQVQAREGFRLSPVPSADLPRTLTVTEHGAKFRVDLEDGHKTGFFCDQRDNRLRLAALARNRSMLDLCCYTGGFSVHAARSGARSVTAVDLDEKALATARHNGEANRADIDWVHADAFDFLRDRLRAGDRWDVVVLDPPRLVRTRDEMRAGRSKYFDLNRMAIQMVAPGGVLLSCSCSGLMEEDEFLRLVQAAARQATDGDNDTARARTLQWLARSGAAPDHPVTPDCPQTQYLKAAWVRVL